MTLCRLVQTFGFAVALVAAVGCGDDDDDAPPAADGGAAGSAAPASGKALSSLTASEVEGLCEELLGPVKSSSTPEQLCVQEALSSTTSASACDTARKACLEAKSYPDFSKVSCAEFTASTAPEFDCDTKVSEVKSCYAKMATWLKGLRCSQASNPEDMPACIDQLDKDCDFGLSKLIDDTSCEPDSYANCTCTGGAKGTQRCNDDGEYEACVCGEMPSGDEFVCKSGSKSYDYDFGLGSACNRCAVGKCCESFIDCQGDTACVCYLKCLDNPDVDDCLGECKIKEKPEAFVDHAVCLSDSCETECGF